MNDLLGLPLEASAHAHDIDKLAFHVEARLPHSSRLDAVTRNRC